MKIFPEKILGCFTFEMKRHEDSRGMNKELFNSNSQGIDFRVEQVNISQSKEKVLRGLHYSLEPHDQNMIVSCLSGAIRDVLVDIRLGSPTFGAILNFEFKETTDIGLFVPAGVAHGYLVKEENTVIHYLLSRNYNPEYEKTINPISSGFAIDWGINNPILSAKDASAKSYEEMYGLELVPKFVKDL